MLRSPCLQDERQNNRQMTPTVIITTLPCVNIIKIIIIKIKIHLDIVRISAPIVLCYLRWL